MTNEQEQHIVFINELFEHWDNITSAITPQQAIYLLNDFIDHAITDVQSGKLAKDSHVIDQIKWMSREYFGAPDNE